MKRTMYYKTKWSIDGPAFICTLADKPHRPQATVSLESLLTSDPIPYKEIDKIMHQRTSGSFETLAENIARALLEKDGVTKVTVRIEEDSDFWVEVVMSRETGV